MATRALLPSPVPFFLSCTLAVAGGAAGRASAHVGAPRVMQVMASSPSDVVIATTRGVIRGDPSARRWSLLCSEAFGVPIGIPYRSAVLPSGRLLVADLKGLRFSDDRGCSWQPHPLLGQLDLTDMLQDPTDPSRLYATLFGGREGGIRVSEDGGVSFRTLYSATEDEFLNSVRRAPSDPKQLYATLSTTEDYPRMFVLRSSDAGASWARSEVTLSMDTLDIALLSVNPRDARELLVRARPFNQSAGDLLLWSGDAGQTFSELARFQNLGDATFAPDGDSVYVATTDGLMRAERPFVAYTLTDELDRLTYVAAERSRLLVAGYGVAADSRLVVRLRALEPTAPTVLEPFMSFAEVTEQQTCPPTSPAGRLCLIDWLDYGREFLPLQ